MSKILIPWDELTVKLKELLLKEHSLESLHNIFENSFTDKVKMNVNKIDDNFYEIPPTKGQNNL